MKILAVINAKGDILGLADPASLVGDKGAMRYQAKPGETEVVVDSGAELAGKTLLEIHKTMRVEIGATNTAPKFSPLPKGK
jgi:hypothetical protein